eukprot:Filipodium_phascolosomae@DN6757_c0_g1_i1.p1
MWVRNYFTSLVDFLWPEEYDGVLTKSLAFDSRHLSAPISTYARILIIGYLCLLGIWSVVLYSAATVAVSISYWALAACVAHQVLLFRPSFPQSLNYRRLATMVFEMAVVMQLAVSATWWIFIYPFEKYTYFQLLNQIHVNGVVGAVMIWEFWSTSVPMFPRHWMSTLYVCSWYSTVNFLATWFSGTPVYTIITWKNLMTYIVSFSLAIAVYAVHSVCCRVRRAQLEALGVVYNDPPIRWQQLVFFNSHSLQYSLGHQTHGSPSYGKFAEIGLGDTSDGDVFDLSGSDVESGLTLATSNSDNQSASISRRPRSAPPPGTGDRRVMTALPSNSSSNPVRNSLSSDDLDSSDVEFFFNTGSEEVDAEPFSNAHTLPFAREHGEEVFSNEAFSKEAPVDFAVK